MQNEQTKFSFIKNNDIPNIIGSIKFTCRETDILACFLNHTSTKEISNILSISPRTTETHLRNIMLKLEYNSKDHIIRFVKRSKEVEALKNHYLNLVAQNNYEHFFKEIAAFTRQKEKNCIVVYEKTNSTALILVQFIEKYFKHLSINIYFEDKESFTKEKYGLLDEEGQPIDATICLLTELEKDFFRDTYKHGKIIYICATQETYPILTSDKETIIILNDIDDKYSLILNILEKLYPNFPIQNLKIKFQQNKDIITFSENLPFYNISKKISSDKNFLGFIEIKHRTKLLIFSLFFIVLCLSSLFLFGHNLINRKYDKNVHSIRSDILIPSENIFLPRPQIIKHIGQQFKNGQSIQTVALVGIGGSGKTTVARHYLREQKKTILWEINSETPENIANSFESLAYTLAETDSEKQYLQGIREIKNAQEREDKILVFVKKYFKKLNNWTLLFDNVENFTDLKGYFPHDFESWGYGQILITSRDNNIHNNSNIDQTIFMEELNTDEKYNLFKKILNNDASSQWTAQQKISAINFLKEIPSFPLDVSIAACYLKTMNISYSKYLKHLQSYEDDFTNNQESMLNDTSEYKRTRYSIIILSLQNILKTNEKFIPLLWLISSIDSQGIPCELLEYFTSDTVSENFIYHLKKYSLISSVEFGATNQGPSFSINRSTQSVISNYLTNSTKKPNAKKIFEEINNKLKNFITDIINNENILLIRKMIHHYKNFSRNKIIFDNKPIQEIINITLASLFCSSGNHLNAKILLETNHKILNKKNYNALDAQHLKLLGIIYGNYGDYFKGIEFLEKSLEISKKISGNDFHNINQILVPLGNFYRNIGKCEQSEKYLKQAILLYKQYLSDDTPGIARALRYLGIVYKDLGNYKKSRVFLEKSLSKYDQVDNLTGRSGSLVYLGDIYRLLGDDIKAQTLLEQGYKNYKLYFPDDHTNIAWAMGYLGIFYREKGLYEKAKTFLTGAISIYQNAQNNNGLAWLFIHLGEVYKDLGQYEKARIYFEKSFAIYNEFFPNNYREKAWACGHLASIYKELKQMKKAQYFCDESLRIYKTFFPLRPTYVAWVLAQQGQINMVNGKFLEAKKSLMESMKIYEDHFGKDHIKTAEILNKLGEVYLSERKMDLSEKVFKESFYILSQKNSPVSYLPLENLSLLYSEKYKTLEDKKTSLSQNYKQRSNFYLKKAWENASLFLPKESCHILRLNNKLRDQR